MEEYLSLWIGSVFFVKVYLPPVLEEHLVKSLVDMVSYLVLVLLILA